MHMQSSFHLIMRISNEQVALEQSPPGPCWENEIRSLPSALRAKALRQLGRSRKTLVALKLNP